MKPRGATQSAATPVANVSIAYREDTRSVGKIARLDERGKIVAKVPEARSHPDRLRTHRVRSSVELAALVNDLRPHQHLMFGVPRDARRAKDGDFRVGFAQSLEPDQIALTGGDKGDIVWPKGPGVMYLDLDVKDPKDQPLFPAQLGVLMHNDAVGKLRSCMRSPSDMPEHAYWPGSSANLTAPNGCTTGSGSMHIGMFVKDASDIERAGRVLHMRSIINGDGWGFVKTSGVVEVRSLFDAKVWLSNRAVYAGGAECHDGLVQKREALAVSGVQVDTRQALPNINSSDLAKFKAAEHALRNQAEPLAAERREAWIKQLQGDRAAAKARAAESDVTPDIIERVRRELERTLDHGVLGLEHEILGKIRGSLITVTVGQLRSDPAKYDGMTCADPIDPDYDGGRRTVAKFYANIGGTPTINDLHNGTVYRLRPTASDEFDSYGNESMSTESQNIVSFGTFVRDRKPLVYVVQNMLARNYVYALTAAWGAGKTAVAITIAVAVAAGRDDVCGFAVEQSRVLYLSGENPDDVSMRVEQAGKHFGIDPAVLDANLCFTLRPFAINDEQARAAFVKEALENGEFGLVVIDTSSAHAHVADENGNAEMHRLAQAFRDLGRELESGPAVLVLCHPAKGVKTKEELQPRGGGAFSASIDGELTLMRLAGDTGVLELSHRMKFRGPGFDDTHFRLNKQVVEGELDNFLTPVSTVVALHTDLLGAGTSAGDLGDLSPNALLALQDVRTLDVLYGSSDESGFSRDLAYRAFTERHAKTEGRGKSEGAADKVRDRAFNELKKRGAIRMVGRGKAANVVLLYPHEAAKSGTMH